MHLPAEHDWRKGHERLRNAREAENQLESLETQRAGAERYCSVRRWVIVETFVDDAVSRAEFKKRRGLIRSLNSAKSGNFELVVARDETRIGGDIHRTGLVIQDLADHRVGLVAGGISFGYRMNDRYVIDDCQAEAVRSHVRAYANGMGNGRSPDSLNDEGVASPRAGKRGTGSWVPSHPTDRVSRALERSGAPLQE